MTARGALIKPWIYREVSDGEYWDITPEERVAIYRRYVELAARHWAGGRRTPQPADQASAPEPHDADAAEPADRWAEAEGADAAEPTDRWADAEGSDEAEPAEHYADASEAPSDAEGSEDTDAEQPNGDGEAGDGPGGFARRPLGSAPLLDSEPLPATRPGMLRPRAPEEPRPHGFSLPAQRPAFDVGSGEPADIA